MADYDIDVRMCNLLEEPYARSVQGAGSVECPGESWAPHRRCLLKSLLLQPKEGADKGERQSNEEQYVGHTQFHQHNRNNYVQAG